MGLWQRVKEWRAERKAEREAIRRSQRDLLRAGEEAPPGRDVTEQNRLEGANSASITGFDGDVSDV